MRSTRAIETIRDRVYSDFFMPSRLDAYRGLLQTALGAGYRILPIEDYWELVLTGTIDAEGRYFVLRHDIDTDAETAGLMWRIEKDLGVASSHYFRLSTLDVPLMQAIAASGGRSSYHYEELATVAKRRRPRDAGAALLLVPEAQELFSRNLGSLRSQTGLPMDVVASHGDFVNRKLDVSNREILTDARFRQDMGITLETRDPEFLDSVTSHQWDSPYPRFWVRGDPHEAIRAGDRVVYLLVHPRHWRVNRRLNARDNLIRLGEGLAYELPFRSSGSTS